MPRILLSDKLDEQGIELLQQAEMELDQRSGLKGSELKEALQAADGVIIRSGTTITADLLEEPGQLKVIVRAGVGVDNIDVAAATRKGIIVMNTPGGNTFSTAEHTISMLMAVSRNIPAADQSLHSGKWERGKFVGSQLKGKTLGVIGLGRIGREVAKRAAGLEMQVIGFDPFVTPERAAEMGLDSTSNLDDLLPQCHYLTVHTPLTEETHHLIDEAQLAMMPKGARVINCARGGIISELALAKALESGHIAGAALDVFEEEPPASDHPLLKLPNVVATPHLGASTKEAQVSVALEAAQQIIDFFQRGVIQHAVNMTPVDRAEMEELGLYVDLARRLGLLHAQMCHGAVQQAELTYRGDVSTKNTRLLTAAFTAGLLENRLAQQVNVVNAIILAKERGIEIVEKSSSSKGDFSTLIQSDVTTDQKTYTASGTLFGNQFLRLVRLGPYNLDTYFDGVMLLFSHRDVPGLIGFIGSIFGEHHVNIAQMTVGRQMPGGEAIAVLNLDSLPPEEAIQRVKDHPQITSVSVVKLPGVGERPDWLG